MSTQTVSILEGSTFVVSDLRGDIDASPTDTLGLFAADTRYLSKWILSADGSRLSALSTDDLQHYSAQFFLVPAGGSVYTNAKVSFIRKRAVGTGFHEDVTVMNHGTAPLDIELRVEAGADFADLFEVKDALEKKGELYRRVEGGELVLGYRRERFVRETHISASQPVEIRDDGLCFRVHVEPQGQWTTCLEVVVSQPNWKAPARRGVRIAHERDGELVSSLADDVARWRDSAPDLQTSREDLLATYRKSVVDLAALRYQPLLAPNASLPAAGLPWFMTLFGRDSVLTSYQALPFFPELAETTLRVLGMRQGTRRDDFRDEEPGKILHETREGELTAFEERPQSPYFGGADTTPLWLILLDEFERWTGRAGVVKELERNARAALAWIDEWGDRDGDGYVEYERRNTKTGLENQCWKDSWDSIQHPDGTLAKLPRATCEIQGYVYDAKMRTARLARTIWGDEALAKRLESEAAELKRRFNRDYWVADRQFFALALDGDKQQVATLSSNIGHLLWSGIVDDDKTEAIRAHLVGDALFSGWGVRTMAQGEGGFNPIGYHVGTVWPHDTAFIAHGLRRYGFDREAALLAEGILDAAVYFRGRLPEAFAGYTREATRFPVEYPTACSPQAWATGTPLLLIRVLLGLEPIGEHLLVNPAIPKSIESITLLGLPGRWGRADAFGRGRVDLRR